MTTRDNELESADPQDTLIARLKRTGQGLWDYTSEGKEFSDDTVGALILEAAEALIALHQQCENRSPDGDGHEKGSVVAGGISEPAIPSAPQEPLKLSNTGAGSEPADSLSLQTLIARWRDAAEQASRRSAECDARGFDGENAHAFRKERRIWTTCADELAAIQESAPPQHDVNWEREARLALWANHGCDDFHALYGDDGEMQCHACRHDFRREDWNALSQFALTNKLQKRSAPPAKESKA